MFWKDFNAVVAIGMLISAVVVAQDNEPKEWIDQETGHRIVQVSDVSYSTLPYFTVNAISADKKYMAYTSPKGIHLVDLKTLATHIILPIKIDDLRFIGMGRKSARLYYAIKYQGDNKFSLESIDIYSKQITKHTMLPAGYFVESINADETLAIGTAEDILQTQIAKQKYKTKAEQLYTRANEKIPMALFTVNLSNGETHNIYNSNEWLSHPQFSPTNPKLIMYSLEGPWHLVDRIWTIESDGSNRHLIHKRTMQMEITGHEFWSQDGNHIMYDWQYPKGKVFFLASHNIETWDRQAINLTNDQWSIHFNSSTDSTLIIGDGADKEQVAKATDSTYIYLYHIKTEDKNLSEPGLWSGANVVTEKLADLRGHDYKLEPNARITPNNDWIFFRSNMFGAPGIFAVEVKKTEKSSLPTLSTCELAKERKTSYNHILMRD